MGTSKGFKIWQFWLTTHMIFTLGTSVDWEVSLQVGSGGPTHALPSGWFIGTLEWDFFFKIDPWFFLLLNFKFFSSIEDPQDSILLGNLPINALDEWDVAKLGTVHIIGISVSYPGTQVYPKLFRVHGQGTSSD